MADTIFRRDIAGAVERYLPTRDVIVLHGARQVGKTSVLMYLRDRLRERGQPVHYIDLEDGRLTRILDDGVGSFLNHLREEGFAPGAGGKRLTVMVDEIQYLANPSSFLKLMADHQPGVKLIVSGSSSFDIKSKFRDSLAGRTVDFELYGLSFEEFLLFKGERAPGKEPVSAKRRDELAMLFQEYALYGGYPKVVLTRNRAMKQKYLQQIIDTYVKKDIRDLAPIRDIAKFNRLLELLAAQGGSLLNVNELANTIRLARPTVDHYLFLLEQTYVIRLVRPYSGSLRSEISKTPKLFFFDTGLMQMLWLKELPRELLGPVFETAVFSQLAKRHGPGSVFHWRTQDKKEIDFVLRRGRALFPIEVKLNFSQFRPTAIKHFRERYKTAGYAVVSLRGERSDRHGLHPWELPKAAAPRPRRSC
ncbi:MAG: ATP-binding protein [Candidatus Edwardsbacteria bacterium]|nr:ATP-binding protein [Candidatus Edwardsbacteria bacterium]